MKLRLSPLHKRRKGLGVIRMPARQRRAVFNDIADRQEGDMAGWGTGSPEVRRWLRRQIGSPASPGRRGAPTLHETAWEVLVRRYLVGGPFAVKVNRIHSQANVHFRGLT